MTVADVLAAIHADAPAGVTAVINSADNGINLSDAGAGARNIAGAGRNGCIVATDMGLAVAGTGGTLVDVTGGSGDDILTGNAAANRQQGGAGNDVPTGDAGNDTLIGGSGDHTYVITAAGGTDTLDLRRLVRTSCQPGVSDSSNDRAAPRIDSPNIGSRPFSTVADAA